MRTQVAAGLAVFAAGALLGGRERSSTGIGGETLASQGALHFVFDAARSRTTTVTHGMRLPRPHALAPHTPAAHTLAFHASAPHTLAFHASAPHTQLSHAPAPLTATGTADTGNSANRLAVTASGDDSTVRGLGVAGLIVGVLGLAAAVFTAVRVRAAGRRISAE
ncbi:hypothetical protein [Streptomyces sp. NPDC002328]|uniref:hypothetical protein n=1 Tax=Streptomyces sp. NPDC002328 TaxID=3364642 RepID=UPI0036CBFF45